MPGDHADAERQGTLRSCRLFLRYAIQRPYGIFFLPAFMSMVPMFPLAKLFLKKNPYTPSWALDAAASSGMDVVDSLTEMATKLGL